MKLSKFKKIISIMSAVVMAIALVRDVQSQFVTGPAQFNAVTNSVWTNALTVASGATTNIPASAAKIVNIGPNGFGVHVLAVAAGTSLATNTLAFEVSADGSNWVNTLPLLNVYVTNGTATAVDYFTNFATTLPQVAPNIKSVRLKYITNSSAQITYWTNIIINTR